MDLPVVGMCRVCWRLWTIHTIAEADHCLDQPLAIEIVEEDDQAK